MNKGGKNMIKILLCDDHAVVRMGLTMLLNNHPHMEVIGEASEGNEAIQKAHELNPDVIVMDLSMPHGKDGLSATIELKKQMPHVSILILTMHSSGCIGLYFKKCSP
jgi:two-component system, NarL family, response regulator NreC